MSSFRNFSAWKSIKEMGLSSRAEEVPLTDALTDPNFEYPVSLHRLWLSMPGDIPHFDEVNPSLLNTQLLPSVFIMDVLEQGSDFRWRLFGTDHARRFGGEVTGKRMSTIAKIDSSAGSSLAFGRKCYDERTPVFFKTEYLKNQHVKETTCAVALPLVGKNDSIERLFGCSVWC